MKKAFLLASVVTVMFGLWIAGLLLVIETGDIIGDYLRISRWNWARTIIGFTSMVGYIVFTVVFIATYSEAKKAKKCE